MAEMATGKDVEALALKGFTRNLGVLRRHLEIQRNEYKANVGAQFFLNLCEMGPERVLDFCTRFAEEGYDIQLNTHEKAALRKAGDKTNLVHRIEDVDLGTNTKDNIMNRRRFLQFAGIGAGAAIVATVPKAVDKMGDRVSELSDQMHHERLGRVADRVWENGYVKPGRSGRPIQSAEELRLSLRAEIERELAREGQRAKESADSLTDTLFSSLPIAAAGIATSYYFVKLLSESHAESKAKAKGIITDLDKFCSYKLNRSSEPVRD